MSVNITDFSNRVQVDVIGCPKKVVNNAVIDAIIQFCEDTHIIEQGFEHDVAEADITAGDNDSVNVDLVNDGGVSATLRPIAVTEFRIDGSIFSTVYIELLNDLDEISELRKRDEILFNYPDRTHIKFYGIDAKDQRFFIKQAYAPLTSITTIDDYIYDRWHKGIEARAKWELMTMPGKDWSNLIGAAYNLSIYNDFMARAISKKGHDYSTKSTGIDSMRLF